MRNIVLAVVFAALAPAADTTLQPSDRKAFGPPNYKVQGMLFAGMRPYAAWDSSPPMLFVPLGPGGGKSCRNDCLADRRCAAWDQHQADPWSKNEGQYVTTCRKYSAMPPQTTQRIVARYNPSLTTDCEKTTDYGGCSLGLNMGKPDPTYEQVAPK